MVTFSIHYGRYRPFAQKNVYRAHGHIHMHTRNFRRYMLSAFNLLPQIPSQAPKLSPSRGFPGATSGKEPACQSRRHKRCSGFDSHPNMGREDPLEEEMATHSSVLVWRIPWTEEPGGLPSIGSQRIRHD